MAGPLKIGVVGVGQRGLQHVEALAQLQQEEVVRLTALADPFPENLDFEKVTRFAPSFSDAGVERYTETDELIENAEVDAIWFAVPPNQHRGEVVRAAQRGIAAFVEKPQSLFYDEVAEMADAIDAAGVPATVGFQMRYDPWYTAIRDYLSDKWTASATMISAGGIEGHGRKHTHTELRGGPAHRVWTGDRDWSGTSVVESGIHQTDIIRYWTGDEIEWAQAAYTERPEDLHAIEGDNPIAYSVSYGLSRGGVANLILTRPAGVFHPERYDYILTTHAMIKFEDDLVVYGGDGPTTGLGERRSGGPQSERARDRSPRRSDAVPQHPGAGRPIRRVDHPRTARACAVFIPLRSEFTVRGFGRQRIASTWRRTHIAQRVRRVRQVRAVPPTAPK